MSSHTIDAAKLINEFGFDLCWCSSSGNSKYMMGLFFRGLKFNPFILAIKLQNNNNSLFKFALFLHHFLQNHLHYNSACPSVRVRKERMRSEEAQ